jgi:hypothetical protein
MGEGWVSDGEPPFGGRKELPLAGQGSRLCSFATKQEPLTGLGSPYSVEVFTGTIGRRVLPLRGKVPLYDYPLYRALAPAGLGGSVCRLGNEQPRETSNQKHPNPYSLFPSPCYIHAAPTELCFCLLLLYYIHAAPTGLCFLLLWACYIHAAPTGLRSCALALVVCSCFLYFCALCLQPSTSNFQLPTSNFQLPTSNFQLPGNLPLIIKTRCGTYKFGKFTINK